MTALTVLLTGATGYIASHTWLALQAAGYKVVGVDNFSNSSRQVLQRLEKLGGIQPVFEEIDVCDTPAMRGVFERHAINVAVHFAAFKAVGESVSHPLAYYRNNIGGLLSLCEQMQAHNCKTLVFSSSATVYGEPKELPIREDSPLFATSPYGGTKLMAENILSDLHRSDSAWSIGCLRYFNPVGAHPSGLIGEDPRGIPNNLMPFVTQVAVGKRDKLQVFGNDYDTIDGTGVRDYIHVMDLADGHVAALNRLLDSPGPLTVNLGTGHGHSVLQVAHAFEQASGRSIPIQFAPRRPGDVASCYADPALALELLGWKTTRSLADMCADSWRWQHMNPNGLAS